uniref:Uncharacterized protein n=1 Tax=Strigamia maritima TaxID=126957 RepID=T1IQK2_STRMM
MSTNEGRVVNREGNEENMGDYVIQKDRFAIRCIVYNMKLIHILIASICAVLVTCIDTELEREKRQVAPVAIPAAAGIAALAFWSLVTLRLMSTAARLNEIVPTPAPLPPIQQTQPQPQPQQPGFFRINLNLHAPTTTQRSGYFNPHVKKREATPTPQLDVDKMLELIRKLDKANCIPKLVCQLHTPTAVQAGLFEKSIVKFVSDYNGPGMQRGSAGSILKAAALLGKTTKSEQKCQDAFPHCPISAAQMSEVLRSTKV